MVVKTAHHLIPFKPNNPKDTEEYPQPYTDLAVVDVEWIPTARHLVEFLGREAVACLLFVEPLELGQGILQVLLAFQLVVADGGANATPGTE